MLRDERYSKNNSLLFMGIIHARKTSKMENRKELVNSFDIGFKVRDCKGVEMEAGDILKMFHFKARVRREKKYMYKVVNYWDGRMYGAHLEDVIKNLEIRHSFPLCTSLDEKGRRMDCEIISSLSYECYDKRYKNRVKS